MSLSDKKLKRLAKKLFDLECDKLNLQWKLEQVLESLEDIKESIRFVANYPDKEEIYEYFPLVLRIEGKDVDIWTTEQWERVEYLFPPEDEDFIQEGGK